MKIKTAKVYRLGWNGMVKETIELPTDFPSEALKVDDWFYPQEGELCLVNGKIDIVKKITWRDGSRDVKGGLMFTFKNYRSKIGWSPVRLEVKKKKVFLFQGKVFVHQEALDGGYIEKKAQGNEITEYEYKTFE